ncbi:hypothetical protein D3C81_2185290 [compost metagenome]
MSVSNPASLGNPLKRSYQLSPISRWVVTLLQPYLSIAELVCSVVEGPKQVIPQEQELAEVNLSIFELTLVVPAVYLSDANHIAHPA